MKKRRIGVWAAILAVLVTVVMSGIGQVDVSAETSSDGFVYRPGSNGIIITGYVGSASDVVVPAEIDEISVVEIGASAFASKKNIVSITLPATVTLIGQRAFADCTNLERVNGTDNVAQYGSGVFHRCTSLKSFHISDKTIGIADSAFLQSGIETLYVAKNVQKFYTNWVRLCEDLKEITIENPNIIFGNLGDGNVDIPSGVVIKGPAGSGVETWAKGKGLSFVGTTGCSHNWQYDHTAVAATCTREGQEVQRCANCGLTKTVNIAMKAHSFGDFVIDRNPTATQNGEKSRYCSVCGARTDVTVLVKTDNGSIKESQGSSGNTNPGGSSGNSGNSGNTNPGGSSGNSGNSGNTNPGGSSGNNGETSGNTNPGGSSGNNGETSGNTNPGGSSGNSGNSGNTNPGGSSGNSGNSGNTNPGDSSGNNGETSGNPDGNDDQKATDSNGNTIAALSPDLVIKEVKSTKIPPFLIGGVVVAFLGVGVFIYIKHK